MDYTLGDKHSLLTWSSSWPSSLKTIRRFWSWSSSKNCLAEATSQSILDLHSSQLSTLNCALRFHALSSCVELYSCFIMWCVFSIPCGLIERGIQRPVEKPPWSTGDVILTILLRCKSKSSETSDDELDHPRRKRGESSRFCDSRALVPFMGIAFPFSWANGLTLRLAKAFAQLETAFGIRYQCLSSGDVGGLAGIDGWWQHTRTSSGSSLGGFYKSQVRPPHSGRKYYLNNVTHG